jgi:hypothetical protein
MVFGEAASFEEAMMLGCLMTRVAHSCRFWLVLLLAGMLSMVSVGPSAAADGGCPIDPMSGKPTCVFSSTGEETFTVPAGVSSVHVVAQGAGGGSGGVSGGPGGIGAVVSGDLSVTPGQVLYVEVAGAPTDSDCDAKTSCAGGFNGGGSSHTLSGGGLGGGGGGASDIRTISSSDSGTLASRRLVAAGGGGGGAGGGCDNGPGATGGNAEAPGENGCEGGVGGEPGTSMKGGAGGNLLGQNGDLGIGGQGGGGTGGGGGGGVYGGGGGGALVPAGGAGGGGGGSNLVPAGGTSGLTTDPPQITISHASLSEQHDTLIASATGVGPGKSLANKARQIRASADANDTAGACAILAAFIHEVGAQTGKKLTAGQAASLTTQAESIQSRLGC